MGRIKRSVLHRFACVIRISIIYISRLTHTHTYISLTVMHRSDQYQLVCEKSKSVSLVLTCAKSFERMRKKQYVRRGCCRARAYSLQFWSCWWRAELNRFRSVTAYMSKRKCVRKRDDFAARYTTRRIHTRIVWNEICMRNISCRSNMNMSIHVLRVCALKIKTIMDSPTTCFCSFRFWFFWLLQNSKSHTWPNNCLLFTIFALFVFLLLHNI